MRWVALTLCVAVPALAAWAQERGDEDQWPVCPVVSEPLARSVAAQIKGSGRCMAPCRGCGCKGGPGYRARDGNCVGYANLIRECGPPPHSGCRRECAPIVAGCLGRAAGRAWLRSFAAGLGLEVTFLPAEKREDGPADRAADGAKP